MSILSKKKYKTLHNWYTGLYIFHITQINSQIWQQNIGFVWQLWNKKAIVNLPAWTSLLQGMVSPEYTNFQPCWCVRHTPNAFLQCSTITGRNSRSPVSSSTALHITWFLSSWWGIKSWRATSLKIHSRLHKQEMLQSQILSFYTYIHCIKSFTHQNIIYTTLILQPFQAALWRIFLSILWKLWGVEK